MSEPLSAGVESGAIDRLMADVVAEITDRLHAGEPVDAAAYMKRHPELADRLRPMLAALDMLAQFSSSAGSERRSGRSVAGEQLGGTLGDFRILREVGRGGMGVVYEAEQISLQRRVALKILPFAATMDPRQLQRFHNEARAAACLDHPHIVKVHAVGCERGVHYFAMKFIEGQSLAELIAAQKHNALSGGRQPPERTLGGLTPPAQVTQPIAAATTQAAPRDAMHYRRIAQWGIQAAGALEHAHSLGIVHRDIKPANLMIDAQGILWITDFGLARTATNAGLTMTGDVVGTLRYMSPEQALAKHGLVDHRTDLYALGATLYELLTLRPAIDGNDREESLRKIAFEEPPSPRSLDRAIPADLETVVLKALAKEPAGRYATAQEMADDLRRYLEHKPILAQRPALVDRLAKWGRRHRPLVLAGAVFLVLSVGGLTAGIVLIAQEQAETAKARDLLIAREQSLRQTAYAQAIVLAWQALREGERGRMRGQLDQHIPEDGQEDLRSFEWYYLQRRSRGLLHEAAGVAAHEGGAYCVAYSPDGRTLASAGKDSVIRFWDARTLRPQGELRSGQFEVNQVVFSPDGKNLASAGDDGTIWVWDLTSAQRRAILRLEDRPVEVCALALSPDGKILVAGGRDGRLRSWDSSSGTLKADRNPGAGTIHYLTFIPSGPFLAAANDSSQVLLLDPSTLLECGFLQHPYGPVDCVAFSHDSKTLAEASTWGGRIVLRDMLFRTQRINLRGHEPSRTLSLSFCPDDTLLVSGGDDGRVKLWDARSGSLRASRQGHVGRVWCTTFAPDGEWLASTGQDGTVKLWHVLNGDRRTIRVASDAKNTVAADWVAFSSDGQTLFARSRNGELGRWRTLSGQRMEWVGRPKVWRAALAPGSRLATVAGDKRELRVQDLSGADVQVYRHAQPISALAISPDGERVAFADVSPAVWIWEVGSGRLRELSRLPGHCRCLAFAPKGGTIAVAADTRVLLLDTGRGQPLGVQIGHEKNVLALAFSPDGVLLATAAKDDNTVRLWELSSGREPYCLWTHGLGVNAVVFSPDGKSLASGGGEGEVILWDVAGGQELMRLDDHKGGIETLAFSPDGKALAAGGFGPDGKSAEVTLWYADGARPNREP